MKAVLQRVKHSSVSINGELVGECSGGFLVLLGVADGDTEAEAQILAEKIANLRVFEDENGKMNLSLLSTGGELLIVSQFTLCADCRHGRRPSFTASAPPDKAKELYDYFVSLFAPMGIEHIATGRFGADMQVELLNDGPVTIILDTEELKRK